MNDMIIVDSWGELIHLFIANLDRKDTTKQAYGKALKEWARFYQIERADNNTHLVLQDKQCLVGRGLSPYTISL